MEQNCCKVWNAFTCAISSYVKNGFPTGFFLQSNRVYFVEIQGYLNPS